MSADRVTVTKSGFVRYGSPSSFDTLGKVMHTEVGGWLAHSNALNCDRGFGLRRDAIGWIVKVGLWDT